MEEKGFIDVVKVKYSFQDGKEIEGIELCIAPKVKKFIQMTKDNLQLMDLMANGLVAWYNRANYGDDIVLSAYTGQDKVVGGDNNVPIRFN